MARAGDLRHEWSGRASAANGIAQAERTWRATYADRSPGVVRFLYWTERRSLERVLRRLGRVTRLVELGCGPGKWFGLWSRSADEVHGLDFTAPFAREAAGRGDGEVTCGDLRSVPYLDDTFGLAFVVKVMEFLDYEDQARALSEAYRILYPGGRLVFLELIGSPDHFSEHVKPRSLNGWVQLARSAGFDIENIEGNEYSPFLRFMEQAAFRIRRGRRRAVASRGGESGGRPGGGILRKLLRAAESALAVPSFLLEPVFEIAMPIRWAGHGLILCRKPV